MFNSYVEQCDVCRQVGRCVRVFCSEGHQHDACLPCCKAAEARGDAIEIRYGLMAVRLDPRGFGMPFFSEN